MTSQDEAINLETFADLLRHGYRLAGFCRRCGVHKDIDLALCPANRDYVGARFKCRACSGYVSMTLSQIRTGGDAHMPALDRWRKG